MQRRTFLKLGAMAAVAVVLPKVAPQKPEIQFPAKPSPNDYVGVGMKGLPYHVSNSGLYFGVSRSTYPKLSAGPSMG